MLLDQVVAEGVLLEVLWLLLLVQVVAEGVVVVVVVVILMVPFLNNYLSSPQRIGKTEISTIMEKIQVDDHRWLLEAFFVIFTRILYFKRVMTEMLVIGDRHFNAVCDSCY